MPLRIAVHDRAIDINQQPDTIIDALEQYPYLVMLGGPGSGKSTVTKHLAWSHAAANQAMNLPDGIPLLSGHPLPLRIELRRLAEERKRANYDFLSFATEVLLKREGVEINPCMFKALLARRGMLLLFDGLDEVATLDEHLALVNEIEHFALCYPGNRVLVTSRPVGYDLARISHPLFTHATVQPFNDEQIQQFLENWYTAVLRRSPIPQHEREEMELLLTTIKENRRLHTLAENPLLLTVMTKLHRYERLPDRRVQVYDSCAKLLLETWAKVKGTDQRWKDMKMGKDDQRDCVAYLGFVLHVRSQEEVSENGEESANAAVDVSSRFLRSQVEKFLRQRKLIANVAEQRAEARRFIELMQEEAGLIVERGTDENGEALYGFVHLTFQEYFAAVDIYERYLQEENPKVIGKFLSEHLHDPHWSEVILLLLGKLRSTPVTNQLRNILQGKIKSCRSRYTEIVQQDLFFVCRCLIEEIKVEQTLVDMVIARLKEVVQQSRFPDQRQEALEYLGKLMQTSQYGDAGKKALIEYVSKDDVPDIAIRLEVMRVLYLSGVESSEERQLAWNTLTSLLKRPELPIEQALRTANRGSEERQLAMNTLTGLLKRPDLPIEQAWWVAGSLYDDGSTGSEGSRLATAILLALLSHPGNYQDEADVYYMLYFTVPHFHHLPPVDGFPFLKT